MADAKPATVRKSANTWLSRAIANYQVGHKSVAQTAGEKLVATLRKAGVIGEEKI